MRVIFDLDVALSYLARAGLGRQEDLVAALRWVDVLKPCKAAARELTGESDYEKMARKFLEMGCARVVMAMGAEGCLIASREQVAHLSSFRVNVVDTTGAGDAFMGGLTYALLEGWSDEQAGFFTNACAALCCTRVGARAMSRREEVEAFLRSDRAAGAPAS